jgi:hypothetical protein
MEELNLKVELLRLILIFNLALLSSHNSKNPFCGDGDGAGDFHRGF